MYNPYFSMKYTDKINNEALFPRFGLVMRMYLLISKKILEKHTIKKSNPNTPHSGITQNP